MSLVVILLWLLRAAMVLAGVPLTLVGLVFIFHGGWFVVPMYWLFYERVHLAYKGLREANRADREQGLGRAADQLLAQADTPPSNPYVQIRGERDIGDLPGFADLGYRPRYRAVVDDHVLMKKCRRCLAYQPPRWEACEFCDAELPPTLVDSGTGAVVSPDRES